jgi:hypothetical protein
VQFPGIWNDPHHRDAPQPHATDVHCTIISPAQLQMLSTSDCFTKLHSTAVL